MIATIQRKWSDATSVFFFKIKDAKRNNQISTMRVLLMKSQKIISKIQSELFYEWNHINWAAENSHTLIPSRVRCGYTAFFANQRGRSKINHFIVIQIVNIWFDKCDKQLKRVAPYRENNIRYLSRAINWLQLCSTYDVLNALKLWSSLMCVFVVTRLEKIC